MQFKSINLDAVQESYSLEQIQVAKDALQRAAIRPSNVVLLEDMRSAAASIKHFAVDVGIPIASDAALDLAAIVLTGQRWYEVLGTLPAPYVMSVHYYGGQRRPVELPCMRIGDLAARVIAEVVGALQGTSGAVINIARTPYSVTLQITNMSGPNFVIETRGRWTSSDQAKFLHRLDKELGRKLPAAVLDHCLRPHKGEVAEVVHANFALRKVGEHSPGPNPLGELELFDHFERCGVSGIGGDSGEMLLSDVGPVRVFARWRAFTEPFGGEAQPLTPSQLNIILHRYQRLRSATASPLRNLVEALADRRRAPPLSGTLAGGKLGDVSFTVHVPAILPMTLALGSDFFEAAVDRQSLASTSRAIRDATLPAVPAHIERLKSTLGTEQPGILARLDKMQYAAEQPVPTQLMGFGSSAETLALGYWAHSYEVAGEDGRYSALQYGSRIHDYDLANALRKKAIYISAPCPHCAAEARTSVTMLPTETSFGVWFMECSSCGHVETVADAPDSRLQTSTPVFTCSCTACLSRGREIRDAHGVRAHTFASLLDKALVRAAENLAGNVPGWELALDRTVRFGADLHSQYTEIAFHVSGSSSRQSRSVMLPEEYKMLQRQGRFTSAALELLYGFERDITYCALPADLMEPIRSHDYVDLRAGFDLKDPVDFKRWAAMAVMFAQRMTLTLPLLTTVRKRVAADSAA